MKIAAKQNVVWCDGLVGSIPAGLTAGDRSDFPKANDADWIGFSAVHLSVLTEGYRAAYSRNPILILGGKGVGKRRLARWIHKVGPHSHEPLRSIFPLGLSAEDWTHEWNSDFHPAECLFIEEIGELPLSAQRRLASDLKNGRLGGRLIASSSEDLKSKIREGRFDSDLFFQLMPASVTVPDLNERSEDILPLASLFTSDCLSISGEAARFLESQVWPGNLTQLRAVVQRAQLTSANGNLSLEAVREAYDLFHLSTGEKKEISVGSLETMEKEYIFLALKSVRFNKTQAARLLGIDRATLYRKAHRYGIALEASVARVSH